MYKPQCTILNLGAQILGIIMLMNLCMHHPDWVLDTSFMKKETKTQNGFTWASEENFMVS